MDISSFGLHSPKIKKVKTPFAQMTARKANFADGIYYEIQYYNPEDKQIHTGYGSHDGEMVLGWLDMYFEVDREAKFRLQLVPLEDGKE